MTRSDPKPHHHGNLRQALITAGIELMELGGPDALTLRKCAARAGVSHAAPAHHFNGLISLKAAIVARGHQMFAAAMHQAQADAETDPKSQLYAICDGYIGFARTRSSVFKFMFQPCDERATAIDDTTRSELLRDAAASYLILRDACSPFQPVGGSAQSTETMIWSLAHGYAMLFCGEGSSGPRGNTTPDFRDIMPDLQLK